MLNWLLLLSLQWLETLSDLRIEGSQVWWKQSLRSPEEPEICPLLELANNPPSHNLTLQNAIPYFSMVIGIRLVLLNHIKDLTSLSKRKKHDSFHRVIGCWNPCICCQVLNSQKVLRSSLAGWTPKILGVENPHRFDSSVPHKPSVSVWEWQLRNSRQPNGYNDGSCYGTSLRTMRNWKLTEKWKMMEKWWTILQFPGN